MSVESSTEAEQSIAGWDVGIRGTALCQYCTDELGDGDEVTVYAYRRVKDQLLSIARLYCNDCERRESEHPALGCFELLANARLALTPDVAHQSHGLTLVDVAVINERGPKEGDQL